MTETDFDVNDPDGPPIGQPVGKPYVGISEFLTYSATTGRPATIVLPTAKMYNGTLDPDSAQPRQINQDYFEQVLSYVRKLITHGDKGADALPDTPIAAFELGNEYWGSGKMTAAEYGQLANTLAASLAKMFDKVLGTDRAHPQILIQMGGPWDAQFKTGIYSDLTWAEKVYQANHDIISHITDAAAKSAITGLVEHYYYTDTDTIFTRDSQAMSYIDADVKQWSEAGFGGCDLVLTEWNVQSLNASQMGLAGASVVIEQMEYMIRLGADAAFVWPVQGWETSLAGRNGAEPLLTPIGAAFQLMSESLVGTRLLSTDNEMGPIEINTFISEHKAIFFVMCRSESSQRVDLDVSNLVSGYTSLSGSKIGVRDGDDIHSPDVLAHVTNYSAGQLGNSTSLHFSLGAFEVMRIEFYLIESVSYSGTRKSDMFIGGKGSDSISGAGANDTLTGAAGADFIDGASGRDLLSGWGGSDKIYGGDHIDFIFGQQGDDRLYGGLGGDAINGGAGNDVLFGQDNADKLVGGEGADKLFGGSANDTLSGGPDADQFVFSTTPYTRSNCDKIVDFQTEVDEIVLSQAIFGALQRGSLAPSAFVENSSGLATDASDRIIFETDTGVVWYDRDGSGNGYERVAFVCIVSGDAPTATDFSIV